MGLKDLSLEKKVVLFLIGAAVLLFVLYGYITGDWRVFPIYPTILFVIALLALPLILIKKAKDESDEMMSKLGYTRYAVTFESRKYRKSVNGITFELEMVPVFGEIGPTIRLFSPNPSKKSFQINLLDLRKPRDLDQKIGSEAAALISKNWIRRIMVDKRIGLESTNWDTNPYKRFEEWVGQLENAVLLVKKHLEEQK